MAKMNIDRSILINKKPAEVFPLINDFTNWETWSPWLILEEGVEVTVRDDKKHYSWKGQLTGEGNMTIINEKENESVECDLMFLKPWKSQAKVGFQLKAEGEGTRVNWTMQSSLPFFLFFMKKMMEAAIGMDYDRGLNMLKDLAEQGQVRSKLNFKGNGNFEGCNYIGIKTSCSFDQMKDKMSADYGKLMEYTADKQDLISGNPFTIYHKWDMVKRQCTYTACIPVSKTPENLDSGMIKGNIPATKTYSVQHTGPYRHIGNAWSSLHMRQRAKHFKFNKGIDPIEVYLNNPMETPENELETEIYFPIK